MRRCLSSINRYWFEEAPAARLAVLRILLGSYTIVYLWPRYGMLMRISSTSSSLFEPVGLAVFLDGPVAPEIFNISLLATFAATLAFVAGWRFRTSGPIFALLLLWVLCYRNSWSMIYHSHNIVVVHALILGFVPSADALSIDSLIYSRQGDLRPFVSDIWGDREAQNAWQYGWPIRLICWATVLAYFLSGVAKVAGPMGWSWMGGSALRMQISVDAIRKEMLGRGASDVFIVLFEQVWFFTMMGVGTIVLELGAPLFMFSRRATRIWAIGILAMHWGIYLIMGIIFRYQLAGLVIASFFDVEKPINWMVSRLKLRTARSP